MQDISRPVFRGLFRDKNKHKKKMSVEDAKSVCKAMLNRFSQAGKILRPFKKSLENVRPQRRFHNTFDETGSSSKYRTIRYSAISLTVIGVGIWATSSLSRSSIIQADTGEHPIKSNGNSRRYATEKELQKALKILRSQLKEDQISIHPDELLSHGQSPNTYHSKRPSLCLVPSSPSPSFPPASGELISL